MESCKYAYKIALKIGVSVISFKELEYTTKCEVSAVWRGDVNGNLVAGFGNRMKEDLKTIEICTSKMLVPEFLFVNTAVEPTLLCPPLCLKWGTKSYRYYVKFCYKVVFNRYDANFFRFPLDLQTVDVEVAIRNLNYSNVKFVEFLPEHIFFLKFPWSTRAKEPHSDDDGYLSPEETLVVHSKGEDPYDDLINKRAAVFVHVPYREFLLLLITTFPVPRSIRQPFLAQAIRIYIFRQPNFYFLNVQLIIYFIICASLLVIGVDRSEYYNRLSIFVIVLVALTTFKFTIIGFVPKIDHLTLLDWYVLFSFSAVGILLAVSYYVKDNEEEKIDQITFLVIFIVWTAFIVINAVFSLFLSQQEKRELLFLEKLSSPPTIVPDNSESVSVDRPSAVMLVASNQQLEDDSSQWRVTPSLARFPFLFPKSLLEHLVGEGKELHEEDFLNCRQLSTHGKTKRPGRSDIN